MSQTKVGQIFPKLRYDVAPRRKMRNPQGPEGRLLKMRQTVTALIKHERIELNYTTGDESRGYAERLISDAIRYGEKHKNTMEMASYWLMEHQLVHKLFKVLVPRYQDCKFSYTRMWKAPRAYPKMGAEKCVLELRDNIYPNLVPNINTNYFLLHNLLLDEARKELEEEQKLSLTEEAKKSEIVESSEKSEELDKGGTQNKNEGSSDEESDGSDIENNISANDNKKCEKP